ncbi:MAG: CotH kinase family protein [Ilumatobacteraceae bacterium]
MIRVRFRSVRSARVVVAMTVALSSIALSIVSCSSKEATTTSNESSTPATAPTPLEVDVLFSEVHYHAPADREEDEFVEIANRGEGDIQLQGWCINGIDFCFQESVILARDAFLVIDQPSFGGSLSNKADDLELVDPLGQTFDMVSYTDREPWSELADGGGHSLQRTDFSLDGSDPLAWSSAPPTPGEAFVLAERATIGDIVITEINYHPEDDNPAARYIEFLNTTSAPIDLNGWCVEGVEWCWTSSTIVPPSSTYLLSDPNGLSRLARNSDRLRVVSDDALIHDVVRYEDRQPWPALADGHGDTLHRRDSMESGLEPGNWESRAASPGVSEAVVGAGLLPIVDRAEFELLPEPGEALKVSATGRTAPTSATLYYRVGFGDEMAVEMAVDGNRMAATIPGQQAGELVRFRLEVSQGSTVGRFPRVGDGASYTGTVVASEPDSPSPLTRFQWFIPDDVYEVARIETTLHGDDGFPAVFVVNGQIMDNVTIRIKGNQARSNKKRKWKVMLPAGHQWDMDGLLDEPVDEFDLLPAATDKSYSREILTSDMQALSGGVFQQVFPVRLEKNGEFFGLYMYGESSDADWRDKIGLSADSLVYKAEKVSKLNLGNLDLSRDVFSAHYERYSQTYADDNDQQLRDLIETLGTLKDDDLVRFAYEHIDIPQVIEAIATMRIVQHPEWQHKNYFVVFDPRDERWRLLPIDFDLNFGRRYASPCNARCDEVRADPWMDYPNGNRMAGIFLDNDHFRVLVDRRTRTLADQFLAPGYLEQRVAELFALMAGDAELDRRKWGQYGDSQSLEQAQRILMEQFVIPKRRFYLESDKYLPSSQVPNPELMVEVIEMNESGRVIKAIITNPSLEAVDVSGRVFEDIGAEIPAGVVIPASGSIEVIFDKSPVDIDSSVPIDALRLTVTADRWTAEAK